MKNAVVVVIAAIGAILSGPAVSAIPNCDTIRATIITGHTFAFTETCEAKNVTPWVYVDGHQLTVAELSDRSQVATFYGFSAVVRVHTIHDRLVAVTAASVASVPVRLRIRLVVHRP